MKNQWAALGLALFLAAPVTAQVCVGDCNGNGRVTVDELAVGVRLALRDFSASSCGTAYCSSDCGPGPVLLGPSIACLIRAVRSALEGCGAVACGGDRDCDDRNPCTHDQCTERGCTHLCLCRAGYPRHP